MKQFFLFCMLCMYMASATAYATNDLKGSISGVVIDKNLQEPLPYVTVAIKQTDGTLLTGGVTDDNGKFKISDIPGGAYIVDIQFIGYKTFSKSITIASGSKNINLGTVQLEEDVAALDEVVVRAETSTIQQKMDRKVITVGKDLTTSGPTASDIMNNLPSVSVDQQTGALSLRGNQNVQVMVDGKLTNVPVAQLLRQIPSTSIKQIELITNPSAKYNPEGMSGIINIILNKNVTIGFNGNINTGLAYENQPKFNSNIDMNYRNGKLNFYGNWGHNTSVNENYGNIFRPDENSEQFFRFDDDNSSNLFKVGVDFYLNEKNTLSVFTNQNIFDGGTMGITDVVYYDNEALDNMQDFFNQVENISSQYNFNYKLVFDKEGHNIELEADFSEFENDEDANFMFSGASFSDDFRDFVDTNRDQLIVNLDYVNPLSESTKLELGLEARLFESEITRSSEQFVINPFDVEGNLIVSPATAFDYQRDIYSAYASFGKTWEKFSAQVGVRAETVDVIADTQEMYGDGIVTDNLTNITANDGIDLSIDDNSVIKNFRNDYLQVYPSAFLTYNPTEKNQYQVSYSRRVDRPGVSQVNPVREWATPLISSFGNTALIPQFTNSFEVNYTRNLEKGSITGGVFYRVIEDEINRAVFVDRTNLNRLILTFDNFDNTTAYGVEISSNYRPFKWWSTNFSFDLFNQTQTGITEILDNTAQNPTEADIIRQKIEVDNTAWNLRMFNNFKVTKKLTFSAFAMYRGKNRNIQFEVQDMLMVNLGMRYNLWDGRGTFSFNFNDIFDTMFFGFEGDQPFVQRGQFNFESRTVNVNLSYRFGGGKYRAKSRKRRDDNEKEGSGGIF